MKELGTSEHVSDPVRSADADMEDIQEQEVSSSDSVREDSDLAQLRSLNDGECSADWYNFQESLAQLQALEEEVVDSHKKLLGSLENWVQQDAILLTMTNEVDYDQDGEMMWYFSLRICIDCSIISAYSQLLEEIILEKKVVLDELLQKTRAFRYILTSHQGLC